MPKSVTTDSFLDSRLSDCLFESFLDGTLVQMMSPRDPRTGILGEGIGWLDHLVGQLCLLEVAVSQLVCFDFRFR